MFTLRPSRSSCVRAGAHQRKAVGFGFGVGFDQEFVARFGYFSISDWNLFFLSSPIARNPLSIRFAIVVQRIANVGARYNYICVVLMMMMNSLCLCVCEPFPQPKKPECAKKKNKYSFFDLFNVVVIPSNSTKQGSRGSGRKEAWKEMQIQIELENLCKTCLHQISLIRF